MLWYDQLKPKGFEAGSKRQVVRLVPGPGVFQAFFFKDEQRLVDGVDGVDRRRVVVGALRCFSSISHDQIHVQEPALDAMRTLADGFLGAFAERDGGDSRYAGQAFL